MTYLRPISAASDFQVMNDVSTLHPCVMRIKIREEPMNLKTHLKVWAAGLFALGQLANGQEFSQSHTKLDQAKQLSAMTGRPLLAVAGEASS